MQKANVDGTRNVLEAALQSNIQRTIYISSVVALGASSYPPEQAIEKDEKYQSDGRNSTPYNRTKAEAHQIALKIREKGLPLIVAMPNGVVGANDHSTFGYFLRLHLTGLMPSVAFDGDAILSLVDVEALAEGLCLAVEKAEIGEDYIFVANQSQLKKCSTYSHGIRTE